MTTYHPNLKAANLHVPGYVQAGDPGVVGAGICWVDTGGGAGHWAIKIRNVADADWEIVGVPDHGDLSGVVADEHIGHTGVSITAGAGLTGGGTIAATRDLAVGAGTGITVTADAIAVTDNYVLNTGDQIDGALIIDGTSIEAFLVRKDADGGDVFGIDTTNCRVSIGAGTSVADLHLLNSAGTMVIGNGGNAEAGSGSLGFNYSSGNWDSLDYLLEIKTFGLTGGQSEIIHRGENALYITNSYAADMVFQTDDTTRMTILSTGGVIIDNTSTEAFLIRKLSDAGDVVIVNTTSSLVGINITPTHTLHIQDTSVVSGESGIRVERSLGTGAYSYGVRILNTSVSTSYAMGIRSQCTAAGTANYGGYFRGSGASTNYSVYGEGNAYFTANVSALTFTDRTPFYEGDALSEIVKIKGKNGQIDHATLPSFVSVAKKKTVAKKKLKTKEKIILKGKQVHLLDYEHDNLKKDIDYEEVEYMERDLGAMISMLMVAVQQLEKKVNPLS